MAYTIDQIRFKSLPNTKYSLKILPEYFAKVAKFRQIWSHCCRTKCDCSRAYDRINESGKSQEKITETEKKIQK